jgi:hypothetical protein
MRGSWLLYCLHACLREPADAVVGGVHFLIHNWVYPPAHTPFHVCCTACLPVCVLLQILEWVLSYDGVNQPEPLAITAAGAALLISGEDMRHGHSCH